MAGEKHIRAPFAEGTTSDVLTATGAQAITIDTQYTVIDGATVSATGNRTINLTLDTNLEPNAEILVLSKTDGTETTVFGTGITAPTITGVAGKTHSQLFKFDGTAFYPAGTAVQID
jgi:hypothetical protein